MSRLSSEKIREILLAHSKGESKASIARRENIDVSTVRYHVAAVERVYGSSDAVFAIIRPVQRACDHPSLKCLVCGQAQDNIHRREKEEIASLKLRLETAERILASNGLELPSV